MATRSSLIGRIQLPCSFWGINAIDPFPVGVQGAALRFLPVGVDQSQEKKMGTDVLGCQHLPGQNG